MQAPQLVGLVPAAGRGVRAYPYTASVPKSMLEVDGTPLIVRNLRLMRDELGIRDVVVVVGYHGDVIRDALGDGRGLGLRLGYVVNTRIDLNLPYSVYLGAVELRRRGGPEPVCMMLADECYVGSNHRALLQPPFLGADATCAVLRDRLPKTVRKNYLVAVRDGRVVQLVEKPERVEAGALMGTGTYVLQRPILDRLVSAFGTDHDRGPKDWTSWLGTLLDDGVPIVPFPLTGDYVNVNSRDDLNHANYLVRTATLGARRTSLVYLIEEPRDANPQAIADFCREPAVDEVVVVGREALPLPGDGAGDNARMVLAPRSEHVGEMLRRGLDAATGDMLVVCYSDDTFVPSDVSKLLVYLRDADMVVGTRTTRQMIEQGANMRGIVRAAHVVLAKLVELLWWSFDCRFTDICCVYRALWRSTYVTIRAQLEGAGPAIFPEMVIEVLRARRRIIEIPINYQNRDPQEPYVRSRYQSVGMFVAVLRMILAKRLRESRLGRLLARRRGGAPARDAARDRLLERRWQDDVGHTLLDEPFETPGSAAVFAWQFDRVAAALDDVRDGFVLEIGCGRGHFLDHLRATRPALANRLVGADVSRAVDGVRDRGIPAIRADGEALPFRDGSLGAVVYFGALHHIIDYPAAIREAIRVLRPGGKLVVYEPVSSLFSRVVHRVVDPFVFRTCVYESPVDIHYKHAFRETVVERVVREHGTVLRRERSDFLAYPFTGCYAGSLVARNERMMRRLIAAEERMGTLPGLRRVGRWLSWRFTIVAEKAAG